MVFRQLSACALPGAVLEFPLHEYVCRKSYAGVTPTTIAARTEGGLRTRTHKSSTNPYMGADAGLAKLEKPTMGVEGRW
jgi:hypothetical protein